MTGNMGNMFKNTLDMVILKWKICLLFYYKQGAKYVLNLLHLHKPQKIIKGSHRALNVPLVPSKFVCVHVDFGYTLKKFDMDFRYGFENFGMDLGQIPTLVAR